MHDKFYSNVDERKHKARNLQKLSQHFPVSKELVFNRLFQQQDYHRIMRVCEDPFRAYQPTICCTQRDHYQARTEPAVPTLSKIYISPEIPFKIYSLR